LVDLKKKRMKHQAVVADVLPIQTKQKGQVVEAAGCLLLLVAEGKGEFPLVSLEALVLVVRGSLGQLVVVVHLVVAARVALHLERLAAVVPCRLETEVPEGLCQLSALQQ
jgi:hypothetical protein